MDEIKKVIGKIVKEKSNSEKSNWSSCYSDRLKLANYISIYLDNNTRETPEWLWIKSIEGLLKCFKVYDAYEEVTYEQNFRHKMNMYENQILMLQDLGMKIAKDELLFFDATGVDQLYGKLKQYIINNAETERMRDNRVVATIDSINGGQSINTNPPNHSQTNGNDTESLDLTQSNDITLTKVPFIRGNENFLNNPLEKEKEEDKDSKDSSIYLNHIETDDQSLNENFIRVSENDESENFSMTTALKNDQQFGRNPTEISKFMVTNSQEVDPFKNDPKPIHHQAVKQKIKIKSLSDTSTDNTKTKQSNKRKSIDLLMNANVKKPHKKNNEKKSNQQLTPQKVTEQQHYRRRNLLASTTTTPTTTTTSTSSPPHSVETMIPGHDDDDSESL